MGWPIGLANDGLAQTWYELYDLVEHGKDPDPTPVSLAHLFHTHAHDPLSLVTSMSLRRRRSPPGRSRPTPAPPLAGSAPPPHALRIPLFDLIIATSRPRRRPWIPSGCRWSLLPPASFGAAARRRDAAPASSIRPMSPPCSWVHPCSHIKP
jgi:hypothetical protein